MSADEVGWPAVIPRAADEPRLVLDLVVVCEHFGIALNEESNGWWRGLCPFHPDYDHCSFFVRVRRDEQVCGCWRCDFGRGNDLLVFLEWMRGTSRAGACAEAQRLLAAGLCLARRVDRRCST